MLKMCCYLAHFYNILHLIFSTTFEERSGHKHSRLTTHVLRSTLRVTMSSGGPLAFSLSTKDETVSHGKGYLAVAQAGKVRGTEVPGLGGRYRGTRVGGEVAA